VFLDLFDTISVTPDEIHMGREYMFKTYLFIFL